MGQTSAERQATWRKRHPTRARLATREGHQKRRDVAKEAAKSPLVSWPDIPSNPAGALADWALANLRVPPGHPNAGARLELPEYLVAFFRDALAPGCAESLNCVARKNGKSAGTAVLVLGFLVGPLRRDGWRCALASLSREKAHELKMQIEAIALASGLKGIEFWRRSQPAITTANAAVDILSSDSNSGAALGVDLAVCDELGLMHEKSRPFVASLRSSVSARGGSFMALSVHGDGPFIPEILARRGSPGLAIHHHAAPEGCALDDTEAHKLANPGLGIIKQASYMTAEAARCLATPSDQAAFRALDLNQPGSPSREMVCSPSDWTACTVPAAELPAREGPCFLGFDAGGSSSMTAAAAYWPESKRLEIFAAFPSVPNLLDRGQADGVGNTYKEAFDRKELQLYAGRVTPIGSFILHLGAALEGAAVAGAASDMYRRSEVAQALEAEALSWPWSFRRMGAGPQGSGDVMAFQRVIFRGDFKTVPSLLMPLALRSTILRRDGNGNPALDRGNTGRIDVLSACVLAAGLAAEQSGDSGFTISQVPF